MYRWSTARNIRYERSTRTLYSAPDGTGLYTVIVDTLVVSAISPTVRYPVAGCNSAGPECTRDHDPPFRRLGFPVAWGLGRGARGGATAPERPSGL